MSTSLETVRPGVSLSRPADYASNSTAGSLADATHVGAIGLAVVVSVAAARLLATRVFPVFDDAFITLSYARNVAEGHGLVYQTGASVLGTTTPGYALLMAILFILRLPMPMSDVALSMVAEGLSIWIVARSVGSGDGKTTMICLGAVCGLSPLLARVAVGGMEENVFVLASLLAISLFLSGRRRAAFGLSTASVLLRPEAVVLIGILLLLELRDRGLRQVWSSAAIVGCGIGAFAGAAWRFYGHVLPQSLLAKQHLTKPAIGSVLHELLGRDPVVLGLLPFAVVGGVAYLRKDRFSQIVCAWGLVYTALYCLGRPHVWTWYAETPTFCVLVFESLGIARVLSWPGLPRSLRSPVVAVLAILLPILAWAAAVQLKGTSAVTRDVYGPLAGWCQQADRTRDTFLAEDIGALGYFCRGHVYDMAGLVWPEARRYKSVSSAIADLAPDYVLLNVSRSNLAMMLTAPFASSYAVERRFPPEVRAGMGAADASQEWLQEYVLYRKSGG